MRRGRIHRVEILEQAPDNELVRQATILFEAQGGQSFDGFEVWDGARFVYRQERDISSGKWMDRVRGLICATMFWYGCPTVFRTAIKAQA